jgi:hypothetical protein
MFPTLQMAVDDAKRLNEMWAPKAGYSIYSYMSPAGIPYYAVVDNNNMRVGASFDTRKKAEHKIEELLKRGV